MKILRLALCAIVLAWTGNAVAADGHSGTMMSGGGSGGLRPVLELGLYFGGDDLATVQFVSGTTETIETGGLLDISFGFVKPMAPERELQVTLGYRFDSIDAINGSVDWSRWVLEGKYFFLDGRSRFGAGLTYHMSPDLEINLAGFLPAVVSFDNALGLVGEWDYLFLNNSYLGVKYTLIDYEVGGVSANGNSLGIVYGFRF